VPGKRETPCLTAFLGALSLTSVDQLLPHGAVAQLPCRFPEIPMKLDKSVTKLVLPAGKIDHIIWDEAMPGFGFRLRAAGGGKVLRSWVAQYRRDGATRRYRIGSAEVVSAEMARAEAKRILGKVALGGDPAGDRTDRRGKDRQTFDTVAAEYLVLAEKRLRPRSFDETKRYLTGSYFEPLHIMPIDRITRKDVAARLVSIMTKSGGPAASRAKVALSAFFTWAMRSGITESNPVINTLEPEGSVPRERVLSDEELVAIWRACGDDDYGRIIRLLVLTGCRRGEIGGMCWSEFVPPPPPCQDMDTRVWILPAARAKNGRALTLPLPPAAWRIVDSVPHIVGRDQLFGERSGVGFRSWYCGKTELDARCGVTAWTVHDLRRTVATRMGDLGIQPHIVETILNHASGYKRGVAGTYNRSIYERDVRAALILWADRVRTLVGGGRR
jgi:integrase